ncbi:ThiF family adenylyltransferase [Candidatus Micrarchaeota archaeon]|nr:ThiF family adenylyltransferase [Candidatus Micrarchaeota archaeon]
MLYDEKFFRNSFSKLGQTKISKAKFAIVGLGGTGGFIIENLVRMGAANFVIFEKDRFELSNFNRQILATDEFLDQPKINSAIARAKSINGRIKITSKKEFSRKSSLNGADIVLDGSDNVPTRILVAQEARSRKIPYVFCSANKSRGIVSIFINYSFEKAFGIPKQKSKLARYAVCSRIICPAVAISGSLAALYAVNFITGKTYPKAPNALFFDLEKENPFWRAKLG